ncbi:hypothetical protein LTR53_011401 [Teratosphaeriaceae sp. CCFEE 6253]|nr:hypothetical protein LTR53_011401 [Teratosphaeriaceae sp. CCFEE 6253]
MMDDTDDAALDALSAARKVEQCGHISLVTVPGRAGLTKVQQILVLAKINRAHAETPLDAGALDRALRQVPASADLAALREVDRESDIPTPPPDPEEYRVEEAEARLELEALGGIHCYPPDVSIPDLDFLYRKVPEEYREILSYWTRGDCRGYDQPLVGQVREWKEFLRDQVKIRAKYIHRGPWAILNMRSVDVGASSAFLARCAFDRIPSSRPNWRT